MWPFASRANRGNRPSGVFEPPSPVPSPRRPATREAPRSPIPIPRRRLSSSACWGMLVLRDFTSPSNPPTVRPAEKPHSWRAVVDTPTRSPPIIPTAGPSTWKSIRQRESAPDAFRIGSRSAGGSRNTKPARVYPSSFWELPNAPGTGGTWNSPLTKSALAPSTQPSAAPVRAWRPAAPLRPISGRICPQDCFPGWIVPCGFLDTSSTQRDLQNPAVPAGLPVPSLALSLRPRPSDMAAPAASSQSLGDLLVRHGLIKHEHLVKALHEP